MKIYVSHSKHFDFKEKLYKPIKESGLDHEVEFVLPHEHDDDPFDVKQLFEEGECGLIIAEVSYPATGQGIELSWAQQYNIPITCIYMKDSVIPGSLKLLTDDFLEYEDEKDMVDMIKFKLIDL